MPNKTIYVSDDDLPLYERAQELAGSNLSAAIARALRRYVEAEEGRLEGYKEITVKVGSGVYRKQRFSGVLLGELGRSANQRVEVFRVYRSRKDKLVLHVERSPEAWAAGADNKRGGWRTFLGLGDQTWGFTQGESTLEVVDSLDALRAKIPAELYDMVAGVAVQPAVEDLDI
ncbi:MAG: EXLDI protein [Chloroflexota bacterium]|nr:EXLDI protein [Chloroflexota bacterium]